MKEKITANIENITRGINAAAHRKENKFKGGYQALAIVNGKIERAVDLRLYATQSRVYCCVWICGNNVYSSGSGYAGGYGYHKASAAAGSAIKSAGIELSEDINGCGDSAICEALEAITRAVYPDATAITVLDIFG